MKKLKNLIIATENSHKTKEFRFVLRNYFFNISDLSDHVINMPEESGKTFRENAKIKLDAIRGLSEQDVILADDSGLEVDALDGGPGVFSARYAGSSASDSENRHKVLEKLYGNNGLVSVGGGVNTARFICVLAVYLPNDFFSSEMSGGLFFFEGKIEGKIISKELGDYGFGYDSIFVPSLDNNDELTFGQIDPVLKNSMSHRADALSKFIEFLCSFD